MKTKTTTVWVRLRACIRTLYALRPDARSVACFFAAAVLAMSDLGIGPTAAAACLLGACTIGHLLPCALGAVAGGLLLWGLQAELVPWAVCAAVICTRMLVPKGRQHFAVPAAATLVCAVADLLSVLGERGSAMSVLFWLCRVALTAGGILLFRAAWIQKRDWAQIGAICALLPGLAALRLPGGWSPAAVALAWAVSAPMGMIYACAGTAYMAAFAPQMTPCCAALCLCALLHRLLRSRPAAASAAVCGVCLLAGVRFQALGFSACAAAGTLVSHLLSPERVLPAPSQAASPQHPAGKELQQAARAMAQAAEMLNLPAADARRELTAIIDSAAEQVCRSCAKQPQCFAQTLQTSDDWGKNAAGIMAKGAVEKEDLSRILRNPCIHPEAFLTAVNDSMDAERATSRFRRRLAETRSAARAQYLLMADLLSRLGELLYAPESPVNYAPEISVQAVGRGGSPLSGDRGAAFPGPGANYFVLLCDGMGTGASAAKESTQAVGLIRRLLLSGADAKSVLQALNGIYLLRDDGCFSTVDLLRINLTSGDAILYKWGGSASYLKRTGGLRRLGGGGLPPGLDEKGAPEALHLNLDHGSVLVMLSDGLSGSQTQRRLEHCDSLRPEDVARSIFVGREPSPDDCTAVAIRLRRAAQKTLQPV